MSIIQIRNFGGELPRVSPRALPAEAAQVSSNLLATANEFRPLMDDLARATVVVGAKTLHRLTRDATGNLRTDDATGWIAEVADKNYVKGQINDDATERTYVSFNDGTARPRVVDALGQDRVLGVPAPAAVSVTLNQGQYYTVEQANDWLSDVLLPTVAQAGRESLHEVEPTMRLTYEGPTAVPVAGPFTVQGLYWINAGETDYWNLRFVVDEAAALEAGLGDPRILPDAVSTASSLIVRITCLPFWGAIYDVETVKAKLRLIINKVDDGLVFSETRITYLADAMFAHFDPDNQSLKSLRTALDTTVAEFKAACAFIMLPTAVAPVKPAEPAVPYYLPGQDIEGVNAVRHPDWTAYIPLKDAYDVDLRDYNKAITAGVSQKAARISKIVELQAQAKRLTAEIEAMYLSRRDNLEAFLKDFVARDGIAKTEDNPDGLAPVTADRIIDTRFYLATYTTDWDEESAPSPVTAMLEVDQFSDVTVTVPAPPAGRNVARWTLYRSAVGSTQQASFLRVAEGPVASLTFVDTVLGEELGEVCPTVTWAEPPFRINVTASTENNLVPKGSDPYLRGLVGMPNGVMAGYVDNFVAFCDPYHMYAWPVEYQIPLEYPIVGLGVFGQSLFVGTYANPYIISGSDSASMSAQKLDDAQSCLSARSIVSAEGGVLYASPDGVCFASLNGVQVITTALFAREDWQKLDPESIIAAMHEGVYYFWYSGNGGGCYALDTVAKKLTRVDMTASAVFADSLTDALFYTTGTTLKRAFAADRRTGVWKSSKMVLPAHAAFAWLQVEGDQTLESPATAKWYGDGVLRHTATLTDVRPVRLPAGRWLEHEIEITSAARLTKVTLAGHTLELQQA